MKWGDEMTNFKCQDINGTPLKVGDYVTSVWPEYWLQTGRIKGIRDFSVIIFGGQYVGLDTVDWSSNYRKLTDAEAMIYVLENS